MKKIYLTKCLHLQIKIKLFQIFTSELKGRTRALFTEIADPRFTLVRCAKSYKAYIVQI